MDDRNSPFQNAARYAGDPILSLNASCVADPRPGKINLSIGVYTDASGRIPVLASVMSADLNTRDQPRPYLPMEGEPAFCRAVERLVLGASNSALRDGRVASIQTIGCTGALAIAADLLQAMEPGRPVYLSNPGWDNHQDIFTRAGLETRFYPWCEASGLSLAWAGVTEALTSAPSGSTVVMQAAGHNPTGLDLTEAQQDQFIGIAAWKRLTVIFDLSYQGLAKGLDADAGFVRKFSRHLPCLVAYSFSKNCSLYGERVGGLLAVCANDDEAQRMLDQMRRAVRRSYSSPPAFGAKIVARLLGSPDLYTQWSDEVDAMRLRMEANRRGLADRLDRYGVPTSGIRSQAGMFAWTGLSTRAVQRLRDEEAIYVLESGRLCVAGLTGENIDQVAEALARVWAY